MWVGRWGAFTIYLNDGENGKEGPAYWVKSSVMDSEDMKRFYALALLYFSTGATLDIEWDWDGENSQRVVRTMSPRF